MKYILQHLVSFLLPITVLIVIPLLIEPHWTMASGLQLIAGLGILLAGLFVVGQTILTFIRIGKGTLAPWSPTRKLVVGGMYGYVRNPMILGVITVLLGEALAFSSIPILSWAIFVFLINTLYFIVSEEPGLEDRFGEEYREYKKNVPRWIPRRRPWKP
ncbi:MAG TPA: isoprenylcysteine carboxylmethyltransferase family protein [Anaerolineales bacterium]|nr:isoprenylcysteine carboxylmethyltransferase family protein [Anaerolineales bacterium]